MSKQSEYDALDHLDIKRQIFQLRKEQETLAVLLLGAMLTITRKYTAQEATRDAANMVQKTLGTVR